MGELKLKNDEAKRAEHKLNGLNNNIEELKLSYNSIFNQSEKNKLDAGNHAVNLSN